MLFAAFLVVIAYNVMRQMEHWLHQHIFKVGWLVTKSFQTTTILYYTFFLPGLFLNQFVLWLAAGVLDVRAERSLKWPERQEIGELKLDFIKLSKKASTWRLTIISLVPFFAGLAFVFFVASTIFQIPTTVAEMPDSSLASVSGAVSRLMSTPDFWLWSYLLFAVSNTMTPEFSSLQGGRWFAGLAILAAVPLFLIGVGDEVVGTILNGPLADALNLLTSAFIIIIAFDLLGICLLAIIENAIEAVTGDSAMFKNGKMVVMTRAEIAEERRKARSQVQRSNRRTPAREAGPPSVYKLSFPIPGPPGDEPVTPLPSAVLGTTESSPSQLPARPVREQPAFVPGEVARSEIKFNPSRADAGASQTVSADTTEQQTEVRLDDARRRTGQQASGPDVRTARVSPVDRQGDAADPATPSPFRSSSLRSSSYGHEEDDELTYEDADDPP